MPEALKNIYNKEFVTRLARLLKKNHSPFNEKQFVKSVFDTTWPQKELKQRMRHITEQSHKHLSLNYQAAISILKPAATKFDGFEAMFFPDYVELYGLEEYETSIHALEHFTKYSSSEFAVRPFIQKYPTKMMKQMAKWASSDNYHVRRLASEGCRPRLPWAMALPEFKQDPRPVLSIIEKLKNDESEYVRRSVANNLNDISKDNPELVIKTAKKWLGKNKETDWIVKHACRSLLKAGHNEVLQMFGFSDPVSVLVKKFKVDSEVTWNGSLNFSFQLKNQAGELGSLRIEYAIGFQKANGRLAKKVFKISEADYSDSEKDVARSFSFKSITTRKYYPGKHELSIIVNGVEMKKKSFKLLEP